MTGNECFRLPKRSTFCTCVVNLIETLYVIQINNSYLACLYNWLHEVQKLNQPGMKIKELNLDLHLLPNVNDWKTPTNLTLAKVLDYKMVYSQGLPNDKKVG